MKIFPALFTTEKNRKAGAAPFWQLSMTINGVARVFADIAAGGALAKIKSWGSIQQGIGNLLGDYTVSELSVGIEIDADLEADIVADAGEGSAVELQLGFDGCAAPAQTIFTGNVREVTDLTDTQVSYRLQDDSLKLEKIYVGRKLSLADYPNALAADVGKVIPLPYGNVDSLPILCVDQARFSTLNAYLNSSATTFDIGDATGLTGGMTVSIEAETVYINSVSGNTLNVTRGYSGTAAVDHFGGATVRQAKSIAYLVADCPVSAINKVLVEFKGDLVDKTAGCTRYTGQPGNEHPSYPGKAVIVFAGLAAIHRGTFTSVTQPNHTHSTSNQNVTQFPTSGTNATYGSSGTFPTIATAPIVFPATPGTMVQQSIHYEFNFTNATSIYVDGNLVYSGIPWSGSMTHNITTAGTGNSTSVQVRNSGNVACTVTVSLCSRTCEYTATLSADPTGDAIQGNQITSTEIASRILVNVVGIYYAPFAVIDDLLTTWAGNPNLQQTGTMPAGYRFDGAITEYKTLQWWCNHLALQCRSWFVNGDVPTLIVRPDVIVPQKTIPACRIDENGKRYLSRKKTDFSDIINVLVILYKRDWSQDRTDKAYQDTIERSNAGSQTKHGICEKPELFWFDFVKDATMAGSLGDFYITYAVRKWLAEFQVYIDHAELEFGDQVTLGFLANTAAILLKAEHQPGDYDNIDYIKLTALLG